MVEEVNNIIFQMLDQGLVTTSTFFSTVLEINCLRENVEQLNKNHDEGFIKEDIWNKQMNGLMKCKKGF